MEMFMFRANDVDQGEMWRTWRDNYRSMPDLRKWEEPSSAIHAGRSRLYSSCSNNLNYVLVYS